jgi:hippurate hydrolase
MTKIEASSDAALRNLDGLLPDLEALYKNVHSHPELSMQETRTAALAADRFAPPGMKSRQASGRLESSVYSIVGRGRR